jgi:hypothetical protein
MLYEVGLEFAHSREFPSGNTACGYELMLPLTSDRRLDYRAWLQRRHGNSVCRFWPKEEWRGQLKHDHPTGAGPASDRFETASADSSPASDAPGWTAVTGVGALRTNGGPLYDEEQL